MKATGIIAEYNPFHNGHEFLMNRARESTGADYIVVVMSGAFVQRGEPAVLSKKARTEQALKCGADLVLELPFDCAVASAQTFARGGVKVLSACGVIDKICFGSEAGNIVDLQAVADALSDPALDVEIKKELASGKSYPAARQAVLKNVLGNKADVLAQPNNILGIEYLLAIKHFGCDISAYTIGRTGAAHDGTEVCSTSASACACRNLLRNNIGIENYIPDECNRILQREITSGAAPVFIEDMERAIIAKLRMITPQKIAALRDVSEGLEYLICKASEHTTLDEVILSVKSKRYTYSRIKRILMHAYLGLNVPSAQEAVPEYIRILGMKKDAAPLVRAIRKNASLPVIQRLASEKDLPKSLKREITATDIWGIFAPRPINSGEDFRGFPVIV